MTKAYLDLQQVLWRPVDLLVALRARVGKHRHVRQMPFGGAGGSAAWWG